MLHKDSKANRKQQAHKRPAASFQKGLGHGLFSFGQDKELQKEKCKIKDQMNDCKRKDCHKNRGKGRKKS